MIDNQASLSPQCQAVVSAIPARTQPQSEPQHQRSLAGVPVFSADGVNLGQITAVRAGPDGRPQLVQAEFGDTLGLGTSTVLISPDEFDWQADGIQLRMSADQVRSVLQRQNSQ